MKQLAILFSVLSFGAVLSSCLQTNNSASNDRELYSHRDGGQSFLDMKKVLQENCQRCHASFLKWSEQDYLNNKSATGNAYVKASDPEHSELFLRLQGWGASGDMPLNGSISAAEVQVIKEWIMSIDPSRTGLRPPMETPSQRFSAARMIFDRPGSCSSCHAHENTIRIFTEQQFIDAQNDEGTHYVVPGQPMNSAIILELRGVVLGGAMPPEPRPPLSSDDVSILKQWIQEMPQSRH